MKFMTLQDTQTPYLPYPVSNNDATDELTYAMQATLETLKWNCL
jgi:hypothetical protein